jgi:hypothetical protein
MIWIEVCQFRNIILASCSQRNPMALSRYQVMDTEKALDHHGSGSLSDHAAPAGRVLKSFREA